MEEFDITEFIKYYFSQAIIILFFVIFGILGSWYFTDNMQVAKYISETSLVLTSTGEITQSDISVNKNLVATYREIIKSRRILVPVIEELKLDISYDELKQMINVTSVNDTEMILIRVTSEDSKEAMEIANKTAEIFKEDVINIIPIDNISIVDEAIEAEKPYNINILKQYVIGVGAGFMIGSLIVVVLFYYDDSIKKAEDIEEKVGLSVLSTVPKYKKNK